MLRRRGLLRAGSRGGGSLVIAVLRAAAATLAFAAVLLLQTQDLVDGVSDGRFASSVVDSGGGHSAFLRAHNAIDFSPLTALFVPRSS